MLQPFDLFMHSDEEGVYALQRRFSMFLRSLDGPARFVTWHIPSSLQPLIDWTLEEATQTAATNPWRSAMLMQYRTWYETIERRGDFQQALCGLTLWTDFDANAHSLAMAAQTTLNVRVTPGKWPPLIRGRYRIKSSPLWHLAPIGRPSGRPHVCFLGSYEFLSVDWNFFRPLSTLFTLNLPLGFVLDIPRTWETADAISKLEGVITAMNAHLATSIGMDSTSHRQITDCGEALHEILDGQALHDVQMKIAILAETPQALKDRVGEVKKQLRTGIKVRVERGSDQLTAARYFAPIPTTQIDSSPSTWPMTSPTAALALGFLGMRKLEPKRGIVRGMSAGGSYPYIYDDWETSEGKKATHEIWVGTTGNGKTFAVNCFLSRTLAHTGIAFDLLEPMGHGRMLADAFDIPCHYVSARRSHLNPHDPLYPLMGEQINHALMIYEIFMERPLSGTPRANIERSLISKALFQLYQGHDLTTMTPAEAPTLSDVLDELRKLGDTDATRRAATELTEELSGLATGDDSPYGFFLDGKTDIDFTIAGEGRPRIFTFVEMENNPILIAIAYAQVLGAIMRTALRDDTPRIIAIDEVWRMARTPTLMLFLVEAVKTLRTKRKKVIAIDQQMRIFLNDPNARLLFENCPIRVIFGQRGGEDVFENDPAFGHLTDQHRRIISDLPRFQFLMETPEGIFYLNSTPAEHELRRYGGS